MPETIEHEKTAFSFIVRVALISALIPTAAFGLVLLHPTTTSIGIADDAEQTMWFLGWFWHAVFHGLNPMVSHAMNYPSGVNLMDNTSDIAEAVFFGPLQLLVNSAFAYNAMMLVNLYVTGVIGTLILVELGVPQWLAALGGIIMQVLPYTSAQLAGHANLTVTMWVFGAIYLALRIIKGHVKRYYLAGTLLGLLLAGEFYTSLEVFTTLATSTVLFLILSVLIAGTDLFNVIRKIPLRFWASTVIACVLIVLPGLLDYLHGPYMTKTFLPPWFNNLFVTDLTTFVLPSPIYLLSPVYLFQNPSAIHLALAPSGNFMEQDGYLGVVAIVLFIWSSWRLWRHKFIRVAAVFVVCIAIESMGTHLHILGKSYPLILPWFFLAKLPLISQVLPSRMMFFADIVTVIVIFLAFGEVMKGRNNRRHRLGIVVCTVGLLLTWLPVLPYPITKTPESLAAIQPGGELYSRLKNQPTFVVTDNFAKVMEGLADSGYSFPTANFYAYQNDSLAELSYRQIRYDGWSTDIHGKALLDYLASQVASTGANTVLAISTSKSVPQNFIQALDTALGHPVVSDGVFLWDVPPNLQATWFNGDVWNLTALFNSESTGKAQFVGQDWSIHTHNQSRTVTITALPKAELSDGVQLVISGSIHRIVRLRPNESTVITVGPNQNVSVHANKVYVPAAMNYELDVHPESVMVTLSNGQPSP